MPAMTKKQNQVPRMRPSKVLAKLRAGISREKEAELLKAWHALPKPAA